MYLLKGSHMTLWAYIDALALNTHIQQFMNLNLPQPSSKNK